MIRHSKGQHLKIFENAKSNGFARVRVDGKIFSLEENFNLDKNKWHNIEIVIDRLIKNKDLDKKRVSESVETALKIGNGVLYVDKQDEEEKVYSEHLACIDCNISLSELEPRSFSFNTPFGACNKCSGLGFSLEIDPHLIIPDPNNCINNNGISVLNAGLVISSWQKNNFYSIINELKLDLNLPIRDMHKSLLNLLLYGVVDEDFPNKEELERIENQLLYFEGLIPAIEKKYLNTESDKVREEIIKFMSESPCSDCKGQRLKPEALSVFVLEKNIMQATKLSVDECYEWINEENNYLNLTDSEKTISEEIFKEINSRLSFLKEVGLNYITLDRMSSTLSGGEGQRIRLATQIGAGLTGVLYVCDEPSIGLHPIDNKKLIKTLINLKNIGKW